MSEVSKKRNITIHGTKSTTDRKITKKTTIFTQKKTLKEKDVVVIQIPEEMLIHQTIDIRLDNAQGKVVTLGAVETQILLNNGEKISIPNFCLFNKDEM